MTDQNTQTNWASDGKLRAEAWAKLAKICYNHALLSAADVSNPEPWKLPTLKRIIGASTVQMLQTDSLEEYLTRFEAYLQSEYVSPSGVYRSVSMTIARKMSGGTVVTLGMSADYAEDVTDRQAMAGLAIRLDVLFDQWLRDYSHTEDVKPMTPAATNGNQPHQMSLNEQVFQFEELRHEFANGKHSFKLAGGEWSQFGVRVWPEVLKNHGMNPPDIPMGNTPMKGRARVMMSGDKPRKVVAFEVEQE